MALMTLTSARTAIEATKGTAVTCTRILYFKQGTHSQTVDDVVSEELRNSYRPTYRVYPGIERNSFTFAGDATFDDLTFWFESTVKGGVTPTGSSADKTWAYTPSNTADNVKAFTVEYAWADLLSTVAWRVPGCQVDTFGLKFGKPGTVEFTAGVRSFKGATQITSFTGSLSDRVQESLVGTATKYYVDTSTIGSTQDSGIVSGEWKLNNQLVAREPQNGTATGTALVRPKPVLWEFSCVRYFEDKTELDKYISKGIRKVRIRTPGSALGDTNYNLDIDLYGYWSVHKTADIDGLITAQLTLKPLYDTGASGDYAISLVNSLSSIS